LLILGTWQLQRLAWKAALISAAQAQLAAPAIPLPADGLATIDFRRVAATGSYLHDAAFAFGLSASGGEPGARLITPFRLKDGRIILVDRGWLPEALLPPNVPQGLQQPTGRTTVDGIARWRGELQRTWLTPNDSPANRRWLSWDIPAIGSALGLPLEPLQLVLERSEGPAGLPKTEPVKAEFSNDHLNYALTWYGLAVVLVVVYILFSFSHPGTVEP
jgi:surfeit locus 1 family protein